MNASVDWLQWYRMDSSCKDAIQWRQYAMGWMRQLRPAYSWREHNCLNLQNMLPRKARRAAR